MGGLETEVTDGTARVLLEAAAFEAGSHDRAHEPQPGASSARARMRYERGVDDNPAWRSRSAAAAALHGGGGRRHRARRERRRRGRRGQVARQLVRARRTCAFRIPRFCAMMGARDPRAPSPRTSLGTPGLRGGRRPPTPTRWPWWRPRSAPTYWSARSTCTRKCCACGAWTACRPRCRGAASRVGTRSPARARAGHRERRPARERPERDDDLLVRRAGRPGAAGHVRRRTPARAGGAA